MHPKAQNSFQHLSTLSSRRLGELLFGLSWDSAAFCGGTNGSFAANDYAEYVQEGFVSSLVKVVRDHKTHLVVRLVGCETNSAFTVRPSELFSVPHMQQRILAEL